MSSLPYHYKFKFHWKGDASYRESWTGVVTKPLPSDGEISSLMTQKLVQGILSEYAKVNNQIYVVSTEHVVENKEVLSSHTDKMGNFYAEWRFYGYSWIEYYTDRDADVGSPLEPTTIAIITAVLTLIGIAVKAALMFYALNIVDRNLEDMKTGLDEYFGAGAGGIGLFIIIVLLLVFGVLFLGRGLIKR